VLADSEEAVQLAAMRALVNVDPAGDFLAHIVRRTSPKQTANLKQTETNAASTRAHMDQEFILATLRQIGPEGNSLCGKC
jgi:hypothetical protein